MRAPGRRRFIGPLMIEEAQSQKGQAGYVPGLQGYYLGDWKGRRFFLFADTGRRVPATTWAKSRIGESIFDSEPLVIPDWELPDYPPALSEPKVWGQLAIRPPFTEPVDTFLRAALAVSRVNRILLIGEYNGNVTNNRTEDAEATSHSQKQPFRNPDVNIIGPITLQDFWTKNQLGTIFLPFVIIIQPSSYTNYV